MHEMQKIHVPIVAILAWLLLVPVLPVECQGDRQCTASPHVWCDNAEVAESCGVSSQCSAYVRSRRDKPVQLTVLSESGCGDCQAYVVGPLSQLYKEAIVPLNGTLVHMELVPFGKAHFEHNGTITCQHGQRECAYNKLDGCALHYLPMTHGGFDTVKCLYGNYYKDSDPMGSLRTCASVVPQLPAEVDHIKTCYTGELGYELQKIAGEKTTSVWPEKLSSVPWIVLNGISVSSMQDNQELLKTICNWYVSDKKPDVCQRVHY